MGRGKLKERADHQCCVGPPPLPGNGPYRVILADPCAPRRLGVCTENLVLLDYVTELPNVNGR